MAKGTTASDANQSQEDTQNLGNRSKAITVAPGEGGGNAVLAAWQGIYHWFRGRGEFDITPEGVVVRNFSVDLDRVPEGPEQIVKDISHRERRLLLIPTALWVQGEPPDHFEDAKEMTQFMVSFFRGSLEANSSRAPKYVKDSVAAYKSERNIARKKGPRRKVFRVDQLTEIDPATLAGVDAAQIAYLKEVLAKAEAMQASNGNSNQPSETPIPEGEGELLPA